MSSTDKPILGKRKLLLDGEWSLLELSGFGRQYIQAYSFLYDLTFKADADEVEVEEDDDEEDQDEFHEDRVERAFRMFPWKGGWSAVDFYENLRFAVPPKHRPKIIQIEYASPGFIELGLIASKAATIAFIVKKLCDSFDNINSTYNSIQKGIVDRKVNKLDLRKKQLDLNKEELKWAEDSTKLLADKIGFDDVETLRALSPNPIVALKILLSFYRRVRDLAKLQRRGQIKF